MTTLPLSLPEPPDDAARFDVLSLTAARGTVSSVRFHEDVAAAVDGLCETTGLNFNRIVESMILHAAPDFEPTDAERAFARVASGSMEPTGRSLKFDTHVRAAADRVADRYFSNRSEAVRALVARALSTLRAS